MVSDSIQVEYEVTGCKVTSFRLTSIQPSYTKDKNKTQDKHRKQLTTVHFPALNFIRLSNFFSCSENGDVVFDKLDLEGGSEWQPRNGNVFFVFQSITFPRSVDISVSIGRISFSRRFLKKHYCFSYFLIYDVHNG